MSADRLFCWHRQHREVVEFLQHLGAPISRRSPCPIRDTDALRGLTHITFIDIRGHDNPVPQEIWDMLRIQGAIVVEMDDHLIRNQRLPTRHHPREEHADSHPD